MIELVILNIILDVLVIGIFNLFVLLFVLRQKLAYSTSDSMGFMV